MKKGLLWFVLVALTLTVKAAGNDEADVSYGQMKNWTAHYAYGDVSELVVAGQRVYGRANGALCSVDKEDGTISYYSKMTGLSGATVVQIDYDKKTSQLVVVYQDGLIDLLDKDENVHVIQDLAQKQMNASKEANAIYIHDGIAYLAMQFGIVAVNLTKREILDTYYIGESGAEVNINAVLVNGDSLMAISDAVLYTANRRDNLLDYSVWRKDTAAVGSFPQTHLAVWDGRAYLLADSLLYMRDGSQWTLVSDTLLFNSLKQKDGDLYCMQQETFYRMTGKTSMLRVAPGYPTEDVCREGNAYWLASGVMGFNYLKDGSTQTYRPQGPFENYSYRMRFEKERMIMVPGGYFTTQNKHLGTVMLYRDGNWLNFSQGEMIYHTGMTPLDYSDGIIDPNDEEHFFVGSCANGLIEFRKNTFYKLYTPSNSPLETAIETTYPELYTWVDGFAFDAEGNLWMTNRPKHGVKVLKRDGTWVVISNKACDGLNRTQNLLIWNQDPQVKIISNGRNGAGIGVWNDNGTLEKQTDDRAVYVSQFMDQDGKPVQPEFIYCIAQMANGELWVGTGEGLFIIDDVSKMLTGSKTCRRVKIPRNDGTNLADYLLGTQQINAIHEDGVGRKWIGTASSGLYLVSEDGMETIEHFTTNNSPIPSDLVRCLAIHPRTGEVFVGTGDGLVSYHSDASEPKDDFSDLYAYPNPVRPNYAGYVTITGMMAETVVKIVDNGGNLVYSTKSNGGLATWDLKNGRGERVSSGVYTAFCNTADGKNHAVVKILVMNR